MKRIVSILLTAAMALGLLAGCGSGGETGSAAAGGGSVGSPDGSASNSLTRVIGSDIATLDPRETASIDDINISRQIFDTLYFVDLDHNEIPRMAESYTVSEDGLVYTFALRKGVLFHNGDEVKASDAVFSFNEAKESPFIASYVEKMASCRAVDDYTFEVTLSSPCAIFITYVGGVFILSEKAAKAAGDNYGDAPVGCGPYQFVSHTSASEVRLTRFDDYYRGAARIQDVIFKVVTDSNTAAIALQTGEVDFGGTSSAAYASISKDTDLNILQMDTPHLSYVTMNSTVAPFDNVKFRQALNYAMQRDFIVEAALGGFGRPTSTVLSQEVFGYDDSIKSYAYDVEKAKALLSEAGITTPMEIPPIVTIDGVYKTVAQMVQANLTAIGITTKIEILETNKFLEDVHSGNYSIGIMGVDLGYDADVFANMFDTKYINGYNLARYSNPEVDAQFAAGGQELDSAKRLEIYKDLFNDLSEEAVYIPLYNQTRMIVHDQDLQIDYIEPIAYYMYEMSWK